jgi:phosphate transport system permease protein
MSSSDGTAPPDRPAGDEENQDQATAGTPDADQVAADRTADPAAGQEEPKIEELVGEATGPTPHFEGLADEHAGHQPAAATATATKETGPKLELGPVGHLGDRLFALMARGAGGIVVAIVAFVGIFLLALAIPALADNEGNFLFSRTWLPGGDHPNFGIAALFYTTLVSSIIAMAVAVPIAVGVALFITYYAPARLARPVAYVVDLLAAVPSIIYGLWGIVFFAPVIAPASTAISDVLGWIPLFDQAPGADRGTVFTAGLVLAIMILPVITAISREIFAQTPVTHREGALALGSTRWEMIRMAVLPYGRSGVVSAAMLGLGRALGETVAVMIILSQPNSIAPWDPSIFAGGETFASKIASSAAELDTPAKTGAFIAAGLVLFVVTFIVNSTARLIVARSGPGANRRPRRPKSVASKGATA